MVISDAYLRLKKELSENGIEDPGFEAAVIFRDILKTDRFSGGEFKDEDRLFDIVSRRISGEPLQYIVGEWDFYDITLSVGKGVLIPRQDTETLVDEALRILGNAKDPAVLDLCSGTGAIPLAIMQHKNGEYYAVEKENAAFGYLCENNRRYGDKMKLYLSDVLDDALIEALPEFDLITANPPYLTENDMACLQKEVKFEPETALFGGEDGLYFYREISKKYKTKLKAGGAIVFEVGIGEDKAVENILGNCGYSGIRSLCDLNGIGRVTVGYR